MKKLFKYPKMIVSIISLITLFLGYNLKNVEIDNDTMNFLPSDDPSKVAIEEAEEIFGSAMVMSVGIEMKKGSIFNVETLSIVEELTNQFEAIDNIEKVQSLTNSDYIEGIDGSMVVSPLTEDFSGTQEDVIQLKNKILSWDVYKNIFISNDYKATQIMVTLESDMGPERQKEIYFTLKELCDGIDNSDLTFYIAGLPAMTVLITENMQGDLKLLIPFVILVLLIALYLSFRRLSGIILPLLTVTISTIWTIGLMGLVGAPLSILGIIIPVLMMAVGSAYGIHVISHYYDDVRDFKGELTKESHNDIIYKSLMYVRKPVLLAGLTTVAGFASLSFSPIIPMKNFGIFTSVGIIFAVIVALLLIPALLVFNYNSAVKKRPVTSKTEGGTVESGLSFYYETFGKRKYLILTLALIVMVVSVLGTSRLIIDNSVVEYFKESTSIRTSDKFLRNKFAGVSSFDVTIQGEGAGTDTELLKAMENLGLYLTDTYQEIPKVISFTDSVKRMNQVMHVDGDDGLEDFSTETTYTENYDDDSFYSDDSFYEDDSFYSDDNDVEQSLTPNNNFSTTDRELTSLELMTLLTNAYARSENSEISAVELLDLLKRETNYNGYDFFEIPTDPEKYGHDELEDLSNLLSQYYSMTGKVEGFIGENDDPLEPENIRMKVMINVTGNKFTRELIPEVERYIEENFPNHYNISLSGTALAEDSITRLITSSSLESIILSLIMVFIILTIAYKSLYAGLFGMIPLAFTILFNYGLMGFLGIKLDIITALVGSIAIGVGIDYTIHFMASYHKFSQKLDCEDKITKSALTSSGKAIIFNALSVAAGFAVLLKSNFNPLIYLGVLIALTMLIASLASMTIMPALFNIFKPKFIRK